MVHVDKIITLWFVWQLNVRKCNECGQPLPESFEPPANEPWTTGIFGCAEDTESCKFLYSMSAFRNSQIYELFLNHQI